jgi:hypothetical protein
LNTEDRSAARQKSGDLFSLNAADFGLVRADGKNRRGERLATLSSVIGFAVDDGPTDAGTGGGGSDFRKRSGAERFDDDSVGAKGGVSLDGFQELRALGDGVIFGEGDFDIDAELMSGGPGGGRLLALLAVVFGDQRDEKTELGHGRVLI